MIYSHLRPLILKFSGISEEKKLALRISGVSFLVLIGILGVIVTVSYFSQRQKIFRDFHDEISIFEGGRIGKNIRDALGDTGRNPLFPPSQDHPGEKGFRGPRDILIFDQDKNIMKNDFLDLDDTEVSSLYELTGSDIGNIEIDRRMYMVHRGKIGSFSVFLTRDITQLIEFHTWLIVLAGLGSLIGLIIIYMLALKLAHTMIEPIREHNKSLEGYSHNVAHELKTPLAVMGSNLELLKISQSQSLIDSTIEEIISMERIIDTLLLMANPKKHYSIIEKINLHELTRDIIESYNNPDIHGIYQKKYLSIEGNSELYRRVLMNLIDNALKYKSGGDIRIELHDRCLSIQNLIHHTIESPTLEKLTEAFYQGDQSRYTEGQGLGLALVKKIVDMSGWTLRITSESDQFLVRIYFP